MSRLKSTQLTLLSTPKRFLVKWAFKVLLVEMKNMQNCEIMPKMAIIKHNSTKMNKIYLIDVEIGFYKPYLYIRVIAEGLA